jgi:hypothetical protein
MLSGMHRRVRIALLAGLAMAGVAATGLISHRRVPDIVGPAQVIDGEQHPPGAGRQPFLPCCKNGDLSVIPMD